MIVFPESHGNLNPENWLKLNRVASVIHTCASFVRSNPGFAAGHELASVAEISAENMRSYGARMLSETCGLNHTDKNRAPSMREELTFAAAN